MKRMLLAAATAALTVLAITGCSAQSSGTQLEITDGTIERDGVAVAMQSARAMPAADATGYDYAFDVVIENNYYLTWEDGSKTNMNLTLRNLEFSAHKSKYHAYTLDNLDAFWNYAAAGAAPDGDEVQDS